MTPSKYQQSIFDWIDNGTGNAVVEAAAGSGKTTTIVEAMKRIPSGTAIEGSSARKAVKVLSVAFNKHIAEELARRLPPHVKSSTLNAFGWGVCRQHRPAISLDGYKTETIYKKRFDMPRSDERGRYYASKGVTNRMVALMKANMVFDDYTPQMAREMAEKYGIDIDDVEDVDPYYFDQTLAEVYAACLAENNVLDFDDQWFFPLYFDLPIPAYDWVFCDEGQDLSPAQLEFIIRAGRKGRVVVVGDKFQAIYSWRGADPDAIPKAIASLNATVLPLSICYRCPKSVITEAQKIVPSIEPAPDAPEGVVRRISDRLFMETVTDGDYVLCRTAAPLVGNCLALIADHRKATIVGRDIGISLVNFLGKACKSRSVRGTLANRVMEYGQLEIAKLGEDPRESQIQLITDKTDCVLAVIKSMSDPTEAAVRAKIEEIFSDTGKAGVVFSTVHKAKGLEAARVFILRPELLPHPSAKLEWQRVQERNVHYVAVTRAKSELVYVDTTRTL